MIVALLVMLSVGAGLVGGIFFAFSTFIMKALWQLPASQGVEAMQRINVVVLNPLFLSLFMGTALLGVAAAATALLDWGTLRATLTLVAGASYVIGCFGVTVARNVPRNERLAQLASESKEAAEHWPVYLREWLFWNHVRTFASTVAAVAAAVAIAC